jgi:hypothetical protein
MPPSTASSPPRLDVKSSPLGAVLMTLLPATFTFNVPVLAGYTVARFELEPNP